MRKKELYTKINIDYKLITDTLDLFIQETLSELIIFNPKYTENANIPEKLIDLLPKELSYMVLSRLSDALKEQLILIYNEDKLNEIITRRCISATLQFVKEFNNANNGINSTVSIL